MKKITGLILALTVLLSVMCPVVFTNAAPDPAATVLRPLGLPSALSAPGTVIDSMNPGASGGSGTVYDGAWWGMYPVAANNPAGKVTLSTCRAYMPFTKVNLRLDSTENEIDRVTNAEDYARKGIAVSLTFSTKDMRSLKDASGIMMYVKMPTTSLQFAPYFIPKNSGSWNLHSRSTGELYTLERGSEKWIKKELPGDGELIDLPGKGFEGYIFIPRKTLTVGDNTDWNTDSIYKMQIQFGRYGGDEGAVSFSAPIIAVSDPTAAENARRVRIEGETADRDIFTGNEFTADEPTDNPKLSYIKKVPFLENFGADEEIKSDKSASGIRVINPESGIVLKAVNDPQPLNNGKSLSVSGADEFSYKVRAFERFAVSNAENGALCLRVTLPAAKDGKAITAEPLITTNGAAEGAYVSASVYDDMGFYTLEKGADEWIRKKAADGKLELPSGFNGIIRIPWQSLKKLNQSVKSGEVVSEITLGLSGIGNGEALINGIYEACNEIMSGAAAKQVNHGGIFNIFTGAAVDGSTLPENPQIQEYEDKNVDLNPGDVLTELEAATAAELVIDAVDDENLTSDSAFVSWYKHPQAEKYALYLFKYGMNDGAYTYTFISKSDCAEPFAVIGGLESETRYAVLVKALKNDRFIGTYAYDSFYTTQKEEPTELEYFNNNTGAGEYVYVDDGSGGYVPQTGDRDAFMLNAVIISLLSAAFVWLAADGRKYLKGGKH